MNPLSTLLLGLLVIEAGVLPGVLNILGGAAEAGVALSSHVNIRKISFTGGVAVSKKIQVAATNSNLKRVTLEIGGKSSVLVSEDARLDKAVEEGRAACSERGSTCTRASRRSIWRA